MSSCSRGHTLTVFGSTSVRVGMLVMQIGSMRVRVLSGSVVVGVTVLSFDANVVTMIVMPVIVTMGMLVLDRLVLMAMRMTLGQV